MQPRALIVGRKEEDAMPLASVLESQGWEVANCEGPRHHRCPLLVGGECEARESAAAAFVYLDARQGPVGNLVEARCAAASSSPAVVVLEGQVDPPRAESGYAFVGALRPARVIAGSLDLLTAPTDAEGDEGRER